MMSAMYWPTIEETAEREAGLVWYRNACRNHIPGGDPDSWRDGLPHVPSAECEACSGTGRIYGWAYADRWAMPDLEIEDCETCNGTGFIPAEECT